MISGKQKRYLRKEAHELEPIFQVGKGGVVPTMITQLNDVLEARELIKVSILQNCDVPKEEVAELITSRTHAELVQIIGRTIILYKESKTKKQIILPS
ncbi:ribosome assembly RNA-binding protein YhbY [Listeria grayi]|uniref:ribosome assembly RNA-binding protein YhbY n=1 Tax=Listeria grayi TaxID=1641 RepID=UPI001628EA7F|nr:ribosome assembly RNA-binding protein YhbY [Listeria grayi]MBC1920673.1 ribosome assembly RNA-binding protein YhbY [Listeria grayi]